MRSKPFLTYFLICAVPLLLLATLNYWNGTRSVDTTVSTIVQEDLHSFTAAVDQLLDEQGQALLRLAVTPEIQRVSNDPSLLKNVNASLKSVLETGHFKSLVLFDRNRQPLWYNSHPLEIRDTNGAATVRSRMVQPDERVWSTQGNVLLDRQPEGGSGNAGLEFSVPIHDERGLGNEGAIAGIVDLEELFSTAARAMEAKSGRGNTAAPLIIARAASGEVVYQSASAPNGRSAATSSAPIPRLNATVTIARDKAQFISAARRWGLAGLLLALSLALIAAFLLNWHVRQRSRGIARVTEDLSAIAKGEFDRHIVVQSSDDARGMADNINAMTEQLRARIAREEESRQFESFIRLSAMLTHDLKNAIEGLSLTVNNMDRHFDNEQFRIDALKGLTNATDKLKAIVARLSKPVNTLSGEHKRPTRTDLVPILKRVIAMTAEPMRGKHTIQTKLPAHLYALADAARIEEVAENLILNAIEAMNDKSGTLTIEAEEDANGAPAFSVSDTGPGMSPTFIENRLFRPFSTTKKTGIGLGLYTCREVIRASGGTIEVQSVEGAGTTFRVVLPSSPHDRRN
jgi:signal transduction histidine kinase